MYSYTRDIAGNNRGHYRINHSRSGKWMGNAVDKETAMLFASAPDLLAAAEHALQRIESDMESSTSKRWEGDQLRSAISKVQGVKND